MSTLPASPTFFSRYRPSEIHRRRTGPHSQRRAAARISTRAGTASPTFNVLGSRSRGADHLAVTRISRRSIGRSPAFRSSDGPRCRAGNSVGAQPLACSTNSGPPSAGVAASRQTRNPGTPPAPIMPEDGATAGVVIESPNQAEPIPNKDAVTSAETKPREEGKISMEVTGAALSEPQSELKLPAVEPRDGARDMWHVGTDKQTPVENAKSGADSLAITGRAPERKEPQESRRVMVQESPRANARSITGNQPRLSGLTRPYVHPCPTTRGIPAGVTPKPGEVHCVAQPPRLYFSQSFERPGWLRRFLGAQIIMSGVGSSYIVRQHRYIPSQPHMTREMLRGGSHFFGSNQTVRRPGP